MLGDTPVTVYWTMLYNSCILLSSSFCDSSHIVTKRSILFRVSTKATNLRTYNIKSIRLSEKVFITIRKYVCVVKSIIDGDKV